MSTAQTNIQLRVVKRASKINKRPEEISAEVNASDLYGSFSHTTYRMLVTYDFEATTHPRVTFNKQLLIALSQIFNCSVSDLATDSDLAQIRDVPYRRAQWPAFMLEELQTNQPRTAVTAPTSTAKRIVAYSRQHAYNNASELAEAMRAYGYPITNRNMRYVWEKEPDTHRLSRLVTFAMCEGAAKVFRGRLGLNPFDVQWLLKCTPTCPHCNEIYVNG